MFFGTHAVVCVDSVAFRARDSRWISDGSRVESRKRASLVRCARETGYSVSDSRPRGEDGGNRAEYRAAVHRVHARPHDHVILRRDRHRDRLHR